MLGLIKNEYYSILKISKESAFATGVVLLTYAIVFYYLFGVKDPWLDQILIIGAGGFLTWTLIKIVSGIWMFITKTLPKLNNLLEKEFPEIKKKICELDKRVKKIEKKEEF
jgi:hypothetical protein